MGVVSDGKKRTKLEGENHAKSKDTATQQRPVGDSSCALGAKERSTRNEQFRIGTGVILDSIPLSHTYRVSTSLMGTPIVCQVLSTTVSGYPFGASNTGYPPGAEVIIAYNNKSNIGIILGGYNPPQGLERYAFRTLLSGVTRRDGEDESTFYSIFMNYKQDQANGSYHADNFGIDEHTDVPEWGMTYVNGTKIFTDPYLILIGTDDYTGISVFQRDSLLRLSGINLQMRTFGREDEYFVDEEEYIEYRGSSIMPYEQFGYPYRPTKAIEEHPRDTWYVPNSTISPQEPVVINIQPFHRIMEMGGWLGQGKLTQVMSPRKDETYMEYNKDSKEKHAVARTQVDVAGRIALSSAKGISITKDGCIPAFTRRYRPDEIHEDKGDSYYNYFHTALTLPKEIKNKEAYSNSMQSAIGIQDYHGYNKNWNEVFQIAYHTDDYQFPEESAMQHKSIAAPDYKTLSGSYLLPEEQTYSLDIDDNRNYKEYTQNEAGIHILPSGGIVIYDGAGSEIRFVNGQLTISCAGDINIKPGRNLHLWAGKDIIARSNKTTDISSSNGSVRVKAEENLELLGANNGSSKHGIILESKSTGVTYDFSSLGDDIQTNGIVLKAKNSPVALVGDIAYIRCGDGTNPGKGVVLDAGKGEMNITCLAKNIQEYVSGIHGINFDKDSPSDIESSTTFRKDMTTIVGHTIITKDLVMDGRLIMAKDIVCCGTITSFGNQSGLISPFGVKTREKNLEYIDKNTEVPEEKYPKMYTQIYTKQIETMLYKESRIGNDVVLAGLGFSFRTDEQLNLPPDYYVYEDMWQHIAANSNKVPNTWTENSVVCTAGTTYPFPGKQKFTQPTFVTQEATIADFNNRIYIDRQVKDHATKPGESKYEEPEYSPQQAKSLNDYPVV